MEMNEEVKKLLKKIGVVAVIALIALVAYSDKIIWLAIFVGSLYVLIQSADYFTENAEKLGLVLGIPAFVVGVTIVSFGTSLPELVTSLISVLKGTTEFVAGNVVGSNIANILLIIGAAVLFAKDTIKIQRNIIHVDLPLLLGSAIILLITFYDGIFTPAEAVVCLLGFIIYMIFTTKTKIDRDFKKRPKFSISIPIILVLSSITLYFGAEYTIKSVIELSKIFSFGDTSIIALSAVAIGTSLPELVVSIYAAKKANYEMAIGNVLGSNIFNSFMVMGIPGLITALTVSSATLLIALPIMIAATLLFIISIQDKKISKYEGLLYILIYALFIGKLFGFIW